MALKIGGRGYFCNMAPKIGARGGGSEGRRRPKIKRKVLPFPRGPRTDIPPFFFSVPRLPGETGEVTLPFVLVCEANTVYIIGSYLVAPYR